MRKRGRAATLLLALAAPACFDVQDVDPGTVMIDDFDDGDFVPTMPELGYWECYLYNPPKNRDYHCDHAEGYLSAYSLFVEFSVDDAPDGVQQYPGAGFLSFGESGILLDVTRYREIVFSLKVVSPDSSIPTEARVNVELQCRTVESETGAPPPYGFYLQQGVQPSGEWSTRTLSVANFGAQTDTDLHIKGGTQACLRAIDGIAINVQSNLKDGRSGRGTFFIDGLSFR